uniref:Uncharacterized protein n=1 Tax=Anopheles atroparvus TaxID=41427 RepID=A0AAG5DU45_ANOAO
MLSRMVISENDTMRYKFESKNRTKNG